MRAITLTSLLYIISLLSLILLGSIGLYIYLLNTYTGAVEIKYVIIDRWTGKSIEVIDKVWINGNIDYNNRPFYFRIGSTVNITAPKTIETPWGTAYFSFWQKEAGETYQGEIISDNTITIVVTGGKQIWWANYYIK